MSQCVADFQSRMQKLLCARAQACEDWPLTFPGMCHLGHTPLIVSGVTWARMVRSRRSFVREDGQFE
eukprot:3730647-Alexandrium_andersonii.AAC.1